MTDDTNYSKIKPKLNKYITLRYGEPDPPLIYNRKTNQLIKATSYRVLDLLSLCDGKKTIEELSMTSGISDTAIMQLLKKLHRLQVIDFEWET